MDELLVRTVVLYLRIILYPMLSLTFLCFAYSEEIVDYRYSKLSVIISGLFMLLWGTSIIAVITRDEDIVTMYNNYSILPYSIFILAYVWRYIIRANRDIIKKEKDKYNVK